jgi:hypothetical protein
MKPRAFMPLVKLNIAYKRLFCKKNFPPSYPLHRGGRIKVGEKFMKKGPRIIHLGLYKLS